MAKKKMTRSEYIGVGIAFGVALGAAMDNVGVGIALGVAFGASLGEKYGKPEPTDSGPADEETTDDPTGK